jgi:hypothetical protein
MILGATLFAFLASLALAYWIERRKKALGLRQARGHWKQLIGV